MFPSLRFHLSYLALNEHIDGASTTSRGRRFQFSTILCEKKPALSDVLHRGLYNFRLCPRVPHSPSDLTKYCLQSTSSLPVKILYTQGRRHRAGQGGHGPPTSNPGGGHLYFAIALAPPLFIVTIYNFTTHLAVRRPLSVCFNINTDSVNDAQHRTASAMTETDCKLIT